MQKDEKLRNHLRITVLMALAALLAVGHPSSVWAQEDPGLPSGKGLQPTWVGDNPLCTDLGFGNGFKLEPEPPQTGEYPFPDGVNKITLASDGLYLDWFSSLGIDAVVVEGGSNANLYAYQPPSEELSDTLLHAPIDPNNDSPYAISRVEFCYDYDKVPVGGIVVAKQPISSALPVTALFESNTLPASFSLKPGESQSFINQPAGEAYTFTEIVPEGWELASIACEGAGQSRVTIGTDGDFDPGDTSVAIVLAQGEVVWCTWANEPITPPPTGIDLPAPLMTGGLATVGGILLLAGVLFRRRGR